jgi:hypothetical protein
MLGVSTLKYEYTPNGKKEKKETLEKTRYVRKHESYVFGNFTAEIGL